MDRWAERRLNTPKREQDVRDDWERDHARLIHSAAFRRLQSKTQVLGLGESDFYRTRLTHSMEVAQIGNGILKVLKNHNKHDSPTIQLLPSEDLLAAICLAHDIGHPPFGHGGEVALNFCMRSNGGFEGNGQTLRILSRLDKYTESHGLNPTRRMLLGVLKYPVSYSSVVNPDAYKGADTGTSWLFKSKDQKPPKCYLDTESDVVKFILHPFADSDKNLFTKTVSEQGKHAKSKYKGIDTSIMELADDISYSIHDLEDAISLGMISRDMWEEHFNDKTELFDACAPFGLKDSARTIKEKLFGRSHLRKDAIGSLVNLMITNAKLEEVATTAQSPLIKYNAKLRTEADNLRSHIFSLIKERVIKNESVQQLEFKGQKVVVELFQVLASDPKRFLPKATLERIQDSASNEMRVVCDYVAGMTDEYATRLYEKLFSTRKGSIFDRL